MEKYYIVTNKKFIDSINEDTANKENRNKFIKNFYSDNDIDGEEYFFGGNGACNTPFQDNEKENIDLHINNTENNQKRYGKQFTKSRFAGMVKLRKRSKLLKTFQSACVEAGIVINLWETRPGDYFKELSMGGYSFRIFVFENQIYLKISTDNYQNKTIIPKYDGFEEIKASDFFYSLEQLKEEKNL